VGGPFTVRGQLLQALRARGYSSTDSWYQPARSALVLNYADHRKLAHLRRTGTRIVLRLDGLYYEEWAGPGAEQSNDPIRVLYREIADAVIFQSEFCREQATTFLGGEPTGPSRTVVNGADRSVFFPATDSRAGGEDFRLLTAGNLRSPDLLLPQIEAVRRLRRQGMRIRLRVVGPVGDEPSRRAAEETEGVELLGPRSLTDVAELHREADAFVFSMMNPACPNAVVEAIASGLPVIGYQTGSMPELCFFSKELLAATPDRFLHCPEDLDPAALARCIQDCRENYPHFRERALLHSGVWDLQERVDQYEEMLFPESDGKVRNRGVSA
jgi:glycosyltransferase involved in cell wall biosynthesis